MDQSADTTNTDTLPNDNTYVQMVDCDPETGSLVSLNKEALWDIFNQTQIKNMPAVILSIVGAYRTGKSFLLNYLLRYLKAKENNMTENCLGQSDDRLVGFPWETGAERTTRGITMWRHPFILQLANKSQVAVFVMDSQGLFDGQVSAEQGNILVTLSTLLSSIQVYNVMRTIDESDLQYLELFAEAGSIMQDSIEMNEEQKPFQRLMFLVRDWIGARQHQYGEQGGKEYLEKKLSHTQKIPAEKKKLRLNIKKSFQILDCFLMPNPGMKAVQQNEDTDTDVFTGCLNDLSDKFRERLQELVESLLTPDKMLTKACAGLPLKCSEMPDLVWRYVGLFEEGDLPKPTITRQVLLDQYNSLVANKIMQTHGDEVLAMILSAVPCMGQMDVHRELMMAEDTSTAKFRETCRGNEEETQAIYRAFRDKFKDQERILIAENEKMMYYQKEKNRELCKEQLKLAEMAYKDGMKQLQIDQHIPVEAEVLEKIHNSSAAYAKKVFMSGTKGKEEERIPFLTDLIENLGDQLRRYTFDNHLKMCKKNMELSQRFVAISVAEELYIEKMGGLYRTGFQPKTEEEFETDHTEQKEIAVRDYNRLAKDIMQGRDEDMRKLEKFFEKERERFAQINIGNKKWTQDKDNSKEGRGYFEARMAYRRGMARECMRGKRHRNTLEMRELHDIYKKEAYKAFLEYEKECFIKPTGWQAYVDSFLEDEYNDILPRNNLNHPKVLRVLPEEFLKD